MPPGSAVGDARRSVRVFERDPDLVSGLGQHDAEEARIRGVAAIARLDKGPWDPPTREADQPPGHLGLLVLDGLLSRNTTIDATPSPELLGAGDLLRPWQDNSEFASLQWKTHWEVLEPATVAVLDARFARAISPWPPVFGALLGRTADRQHWTSLQAAISQLRRVDARVLILLWHLGDRWGRAHPDGVHLSLPLTHALLGRLVGAQRPSVTLAVSQLAEARRVRREPGGDWVLLRPVPELAELLARPGGRRRDHGSADA